MAHFPIGLRIEGRRSVVVGGGKVAERKVLGLLAAGARVVVISPDLTSHLVALRDQARIEHVARGYQVGDFDGAFVALLATDDRASNCAAARDARSSGALVNVADDPAENDFDLPAVLRRGDLVVAVSTNARSPAAASYIRDELSRLLGSQYSNLVLAMAEVRDELRRLGRPASREAWRAAIDGKLLDLVGEGRLADGRSLLLERLARQRRAVDAATGGDAGGEIGMVSLVGAGPGDAGLITVRGLERLRRADVVVYDHLVAEKLLDEAPVESERVYAGKLASKHTMRQGQINALLVAKAREGKRVVRLKGGDPFVFGRGGEEAQALVAAGVPFEVVPGVSSAVAVPAYAGIPVTHRSHASSFAVVTGHEDPSKKSSTVDWSKLATAVDTLVCLMGAQNLSHIVERLLHNGRGADTPIALIRWGSWPNQETIVGTLANIESLVAERDFGPPAIAVVGDVVRLRETIRWYDEQAPAP